MSTQPAVRTLAGRPRFMPPAGACDTHFHVFGPGPGQSHDSRAAYAPVDAPMSALDAMHRALGIDHGVLILSSAVNIDYPAYIAELQANPRMRGIVVTDERTTDADLERLHQAGVRGVRFHFADFIKKRPGIETFTRMAERIAGLGWHLLLHVEGKDVIELSPLFRALKLPFIIDHIAHLDVALGVEQPGFRALLELQRCENCWVKIANSDRWSRTGAPSYADAIPFGKALIAGVPERIIWGTDWPHVMYKNPRNTGDPLPDDADLLNLLYDMVPGAATLKRILVDNPRRLYPF
ncbi:MAG: hypothetical protein EXR27_13770 [Betaproteobacteria bacterium]|nr:hypothetical protein [Betaproteobacteria bacterium]